jgi:SHS2 domain-containing protein
VIAPASAGFEIFAVTADKGIRAWGPTLPALFQEAARGLASLMVEADRIACQEWVSVAAAGGDRETLLVAWLNELLFLHETRRFVAGDWRILSLDETALAALVGGEAADPDRHRPIGHVKAVTYHDLSVRRTEAGWEARVVVDV